MNLTISQPNLAALVARGGAVVGKASVASILANIRLTADETGLALASTDGDRFAEATSAADVETSGACTVNHAAFAALISRYPKDGVVTLDLETPSLLRVKCGRSRVAFGVLPAKNFPQWADVEAVATFTMSGARLVSLLGRAKTAMQQGSTALSCVFIGPRDGGLRFAATDTVIAIDTDEPLEGMAEAPPMLVPAEAIAAAERVFKGEAQVTVQVSQNKIGFVAEGVKIASKLVSSTYPAWWDFFFASRSDTKIEFNRAEFLAALDRVVLSADNEGTFAVVVAIPREDGLELKAVNSTGGEGRDGVEAAISEGFVPFGFDHRRVASLLGAMTAERVIVEQVFVKNNRGGEDDRYIVHANDEAGFIGCFSSIAINKDMAA